jgi:hypothetical protein
MSQTKVIEKIRTRILCSITFFFRKSCLNEIKWKNIVESGRRQMTIWCVGIACWISEDANALSYYLNSYCVYTTTMVTRTRLIVTFTSTPTQSCLVYSCGNVLRVTVARFVQTSSYRLDEQVNKFVTSVPKPFMNRKWQMHGQMCTSTLKMRFASSISAKYKRFSYVIKWNILVSI